MFLATASSGGGGSNVTAVVFIALVLAFFWWRYTKKKKRDAARQKARQVIASYLGVSQIVSLGSVLSGMRATLNPDMLCGVNSSDVLIVDAGELWRLTTQLCREILSQPRGTTETDDLPSLSSMASPQLVRLRIPRDAITSVAMSDESRTDTHVQYVPVRTSRRRATLEPIRSQSTEFKYVLQVDYVDKAGNTSELAFSFEDRGRAVNAEQVLQGARLPLKARPRKGRMACPVCAEDISRQAKKCRFCGADLGTGAES